MSAWIIVGLLVVIVLQLWDLRSLKVAELADRTAYREAQRELAELDAVFMQRYPNLFIDWRQKVRDWQALIAETGTEASWMQRLRELEKKSGKAAGDSTTLSALVDASVAFELQIATERKLTPDEGQFLLYVAWDRLKSHAITDSRVEEVALVPHFKDFLEREVAKVTARRTLLR